MQIRLNGELRDTENGSTLETLVDALKLDIRKVAVEVNLTIVPRSLYGNTPLHDGDAVEIVRFIGGG